MPHFQRVGDVPRRRHTQFRQADGSLYCEELVGEEGFSGDSALLYHRYSPGAVVSVKPFERATTEFTANTPLLPRHLRCHDIGAAPEQAGPEQAGAEQAGPEQGNTAAGDLVTGRVPLLGNADVEICYAVAAQPSPLYRNAVGNELVYVESGTARFESSYGALDVGRGDYVIVPTAVTHRWVPTGEAPLRALVVESSGHIGAPDRYLSARGQFLESAPMCELDLRIPAEPLLHEGDGVEVVYKRRDGWSTYTMTRHPFDVVGWFGCMYPYAFNIWDFSPVTGSLHRPPPVHQTFAGPNFVVCSFVPRLFDYDPLAIPVPPWHANVDSDEVLFYADGSFMSRAGSGIEQGSISLHPGGFVHGPHPGSIEKAIGVPRTEETAVMIDTFAPLSLSRSALDVESKDYVLTWQT